jgi:hypothetical protein
LDPLARLLIDFDYLRRRHRGRHGRMLCCRQLRVLLSFLLLRLSHGCRPSMDVQATIQNWQMGGSLLCLAGYATISGVICGRMLCCRQLRVLLSFLLLRLSHGCRITRSTGARGPIGDRPSMDVQATIQNWQMGGSLLCLAGYATISGVPGRV